MLAGVLVHLLNLLFHSFPRNAPLSQEAILDIKRIRVSYLRTWFIPDVIAAFPIGYILLFAVIMNTAAAADKSCVSLPVIKNWWILQTISSKKRFKSCCEIAVH